MRIYLVRHGSTPYNEKGFYQGITDIPLSERGRQEAKMAGETLKFLLGGEEVSTVYVSPLRRAVETAEIAVSTAGLRSTLVKDKRLREIDFGKWEGLTQREVAERYGELLLKWWTRPLEVRFPGGESFRECVDRVRNFLEDVDMSGNVVIFSHGLIIRVVICLLVGFRLDRVRMGGPSPGSVSVVRGYLNPDNWVLERFNFLLVKTG